MQELYKKSSLALLRAKKRMKADDDPTFLEGARRILDFMYSAWQDQKCCDLIIKVTGGDIHAHSVAFGAYSETLTNSFYGYSNGEIITLDLSDFRREVVLAIVNFLYTTELELNCHIIGQALSCATKLGMDIIVHMCMDYLSRVSVDNAVLHYSIAENNNLKELRDNILRFLLENFSNVSSSKHFVYLPFNRLIAILKNENLHVNDEVDVFRAVVRWVDHERSSRIEHSTELLQCVRFPLMPAEVLASEVETSDWIFVNQELWRDCLYKAMKYNALNGSEGNPGQPSPHSLASISSKSQDGRRLGGMESNGEKMAGDSSGVRGKGFESIDQYQGQEMMRSDLSANSSGHQGSSSPQLGQPRTSQMGQAWSSYQIQQQRSSGDLTSRSTQQLQPRASQQQPAQLPQQQRSAHQLAQQRQSTNQMLHQRQSLHQLQQANVSQHSTQQMQEMQMRQCSKQINSEVQRKSNHQFQQSPQSQSHLTSQQNSTQLQQKCQISPQISLQSQQSERMFHVGLLNQGQSPRSQVSSGILSPNYSALRPSSSRQSSGQGQRNSTMSLPLNAQTSARSYQQFVASVPCSTKVDLLTNNASANAATSMQRLTSQDLFLMSEESVLCSPSEPTAYLARAAGWGETSNKEYKALAGTKGLLGKPSPHLSNFIWMSQHAMQQTKLKPLSLNVNNANNGHELFKYGSPNDLSTVVWEFMNDELNWEKLPTNLNSAIQQQDLVNRATGTMKPVVNLGEKDHAFKDFYVLLDRMVLIKPGTACPLRRVVYPINNPMGKGIKWCRAKDSLIGWLLTWVEYPGMVQLMLEWASNAGLYNLDLAYLTDGRMEGRVDIHAGLHFLSNSRSVRVQRLLTIPYTATSYIRENLPQISTEFNESVKKLNKIHGSLMNTRSVEAILAKFEISVPTPPPNQDCTICLARLTSASHYAQGSGSAGAVKLCKCPHVFHRDCIAALYSSSAQDGSLKCPVCRMSYGVKRGCCPDGEMRFTSIGDPLAGFACGTISISYDIHPGTQGIGHPNPGQPFLTHDFPRKAYLPDNNDGRKILNLFKKAWARKLTFTVGTSMTTGTANSVIWNRILHKTNPSSNQNGFGYPDPNYFISVRAQLAAQGVTDDQSDSDD